MPKGLQPGNKLWQLGVASKYERKEVLANFLEHIGVNGIKKYEDLLQKVGSDEQLTASEKLFMQKIENLFEYIIPKLSRTELAGSRENPIQVVEIVKYKQNQK